MVFVVSILSAALIMFLVGWFVRKRVEDKKLDNAERMAESILAEAAAQAETLKNTAELESKDEWYRAKADFERESNTVRQELQRTEKRIATKEHNLDRKADVVSKKERELSELERQFRKHEQELSARDEELETLIHQQNTQLEFVAGMTTEEAKALLMSNLEVQVRSDAAQIARNIQY